MKLIKPSHEILTPINKDEVYKSIEIAARTCYKSEDKICTDSAAKMVARLVDSGHEAMIEHASMSVRFICDRGVSHELVRHRIASFAQESTRYANYSKDKFGNQCTFIIPLWCNISEGEIMDDDPIYADVYKSDSKLTKPEVTWMLSMQNAEQDYLSLLKDGWKPQEARTVLPNSLKTEIVVTANFREWRQIFRLRAAKAAHPQMRELMIPLLAEMKEKMPEMFNDINVD